MSSWCAGCLAAWCGLVLLSCPVLRWLYRRAPLEPRPGYYEWLGDDNEFRPDE